VPQDWEDGQGEPPCEDEEDKGGKGYGVAFVRVHELGGWVISVGIGIGIGVVIGEEDILHNIVRAGAGGLLQSSWNQGRRMTGSGPGSTGPRQG